MTHVDLGLPAGTQFVGVWSQGQIFSAGKTAQDAVFPSELGRTSFSSAWFVLPVLPLILAMVGYIVFDVDLWVVPVAILLATFAWSFLARLRDESLFYIRFYTHQGSQSEPWFAGMRRKLAFVLPLHTQETQKLIEVSADGPVDKRVLDALETSYALHKQGSDARSQTDNKKMSEADAVISTWLGEPRMAHFGR